MFYYFIIIIIIIHDYCWAIMFVLFLHIYVKLK